MTIWEKVILNMRRGSQRIAIAASVMAERARVEIAVVRLRIRLDEVQARIDELYQGIGRRTRNLSADGALPKLSEQLLQDEEISSALAELTEREKEIEDLMNEIRSMEMTIKAETKPGEAGRV